MWAAPVGRPRGDHRRTVAQPHVARHRRPAGAASDHRCRDHLEWRRLHRMGGPWRRAEGRPAVGRRRAGPRLLRTGRHAADRHRRGSRTRLARPGGLSRRRGDDPAGACAQGRARISWQRRSASRSKTRPSGSSAWPMPCWCSRSARWRSNAASTCGNYHAHCLRRRRSDLRRHDRPRPRHARRDRAAPSRRLRGGGLARRRHSPHGASALPCAARASRCRCAGADADATARDHGP